MLVFDATSVVPAALLRMPLVAYRMLTWSMVAAIAPWGTPIPYHEFWPALLDVGVTFCAAVPLACSVPRTWISERDVSLPHAITSPVGNCSVTPGLIVSVTPGPTMRSPWMV